MKKKQVNSILVNQSKRRNTIVSYAFVIAILLLISILLLRLYICDGNASYVKFSEYSDVDYQVYLKENDFYEGNYLEKDNQYIASLIDYISSNFTYELDVSEANIDYTYSYVVESTVTVKEKSTNKNVYEYSEILEESGLVNENSNKTTIINESLDIDYNYYNDLITKFVNVYDLDNVDSTLTVSMYVTILGNCGDLDTEDSESVISISIPLTTNTIGIDITEDLIDESEEVLKICNDTNVSIILLIVGIIFIVMDLYIVYLLVKYIINTRTADSIYERELKKILNSYKSYIQKVNNSMELDKYQIMKVDTFTDMLEIRDTINSPILMVESNDAKGVFFCIPSNTKLLYTYSLRVSDIEKELKEKQNGKEE